MKLTSRLAAIGAAFALIVVLAACGGPEPSPAAGTNHNDADVEFAQMMIPHHEGAVAMADLAVKSASTEQVRELGKRISAAQGPEIEQMSGWLKAWGEQVSGGSGMAGMDMGDSAQDGAMADLGAATGADVDRRFLELMIEHHKGALEMADAQLAAGKNPKALELARTIIDAQQAEISEMKGMLATLKG